MKNSKLKPFFLITILFCLLFGSFIPVKAQSKLFPLSNYWTEQSSPLTASQSDTEINQATVKNSAPDQLLTIANDGRKNRKPTTVYNNTHNEFLAIWQSETFSTLEIYARQIRSDNTLSDPHRISPAGVVAKNPDGAYNDQGELFFIVYQTGFEIYAHLVSWDLTSISDPIIVDNGNSIRDINPQVLYNGEENEFIIFSQSFASGGLGGVWELHAQRFNAADGTFKSQSVILVEGGWGQFDYRGGSFDIVLSPSGEEFLFVYDRSDLNIYKITISSDLNTIGDEELLLTGTAAGIQPTLASDPNQYLFSSKQNNTITGSYLSFTGVSKSGPIDIYTSANNKFDVDYGVGYSYLFAFEDENQNIIGKYLLPCMDEPQASTILLIDRDQPLTLGSVTCQDSGDCFVIVEEEIDTNVINILGRKVLAPDLTYSDVLPHLWSYNFIQSTFDAGISSGYPDGTYRPESPVTRAEMAVVLLRGMGITVPSIDNSHPFSDIAGHWAEAYIEELYDQGITAGYPDGTFQPDGLITRAEMAVFLLNGLAVNPPALDGSHPFTDVSGHWAEIFIEELYDQGISGGYPDGTYRPENLVTRAEMAVFLVNTFNIPLP